MPNLGNYATYNLEQIHFYISEIKLHPIMANQVVRAIQTKILTSIPNYPFRFPEVGISYCGKVLNALLLF